MNTIINSVKFRADEKLEKFINEKVAKLDRMIDSAVKCEVTLKVDKPESDNNKIAELSLNLPGQTLFNSKQADTFEEAVADCVDSMKGQIDKYKERYKLLNWQVKWRMSSASQVISRPRLMVSRRS